VRNKIIEHLERFSLIKDTQHGFVKKINLVWPNWNFEDRTYFLEISLQYTSWLQQMIKFVNIVF